MQKELVVFCAVLGIALAAVALSKPDPKPEKYKDVEGCYIKDLDVVIPFGEDRPARSACMEYQCGHEWVQIETCGLASVQPPYKLVEEKNKPFPGCCPRFPNAEERKEMERANKI